MRNFVQTGEVIEIASPGTVTAGTGVLTGNLFGVALNGATIGQPLQLQTEGVVDIAKVGGVAVSLGARVFWVPGSSAVNTTAASQVCVGVAVVAAGTGDATVRIKLAPVAVTPSGT
jgi:predicted RecA/RadA family phage recombinase